MSGGPKERCPHRAASTRSSRAPRARTAAETGQATPPGANEGPEARGVPPGKTGTSSIARSGRLDSFPDVTLPGCRAMSATWATPNTWAPRPTLVLLSSPCLRLGHSTPSSTPPCLTCSAFLEQKKELARKLDEKRSRKERREADARWREQKRVEEARSLRHQVGSALREADRLRAMMQGQAAQAVRTRAREALWR